MCLKKVTEFTPHDAVIASLLREDEAGREQIDIHTYRTRYGFRDGYAILIACALFHRESEK
jgi:hypothetical protein